MTAGYSGTALAKKLGIKEGFTVRLVQQPAYYFDLFTDFPQNKSFKGLYRYNRRYCKSNGFEKWTGRY